MIPNALHNSSQEANSTNMNMNNINNNYMKYNNDLLSHAESLALYFGFGRHFVPAVYKQIKYSWEAVKYNNNNNNKEEEEIIEEYKIQQAVLLKVLTCIFPDALYKALEETPQQRESLLMKRISTFLSFHEPEININHYITTTNQEAKENNNNNNNNNNKDIYNILGELFNKHYSSLLQNDELMHVGVKENNNNNNNIKRNNENIYLQDWDISYGLQNNDNLNITRLQSNFCDVMLDTMELENKEKVNLELLESYQRKLFQKKELNSVEAGTMTESQLLLKNKEIFSPFSRIYGTGQPLSVLNTLKLKQKEQKMIMIRNNLQNKYILPNPSIVLEADSCQKCILLELEINKMKETLQRLYRINIEKEEEMFYNEAMQYAYQEQAFLDNNNNNHNNNNIHNNNIIKPFNTCYECKELRMRIKKLEQNLRESYDNRRELNIKLRQSKIPSSPHILLMSPLEKNNKMKSVSTMTVLTGKELDALRGYLILDAL